MLISTTYLDILANVMTNFFQSKFFENIDIVYVVGYERQWIFVEDNMMTNLGERQKMLIIKQDMTYKEFVQNLKLPFKSKFKAETYPYYNKC